MLGILQGLDVTRFWHLEVTERNMYRNKLQNFFADCFKINKKFWLNYFDNFKVITVEAGERYLKEFVIKFA